MVPVFEPTSSTFATERSEIYLRLRDERPVFLDLEHNTWVLSRFADVHAAAADPDTFSSVATESDVLLPMLNYLDAPRHAELRGVVRRAFAPTRIASLEPFIITLAQDPIDEYLVGGGDLIGSFAAPLVATIIGRLIGIPEDQIPEFRVLTDGLLFLGQQGAVEEMLRLNPPAENARTTRRDVTLHGVTSTEGSRVQLLWGAANLDKREFPDPERFNIYRRPNRHLAFGQGPHFCLGAPLARLEARIPLHALLDRCSELELLEPLTRSRSLWAYANEGVGLAPPKSAAR